MEKIIRSRALKRFLAIIPVLSLTLLTFSMIFWTFNRDSYKDFFYLISTVSGFSLLSMPAYFYILYRHNFCTYSKVSMWGIFIFVVMNFTRTLLRITIGFEVGHYSEIIQTTMITVFLILSIFYVFKKR